MLGHTVSYDVPDAHQDAQFCLTRHFVCAVPAPPAPEPVLFHQTHGTTGIGSVHVVYGIVHATHQAAQPENIFIQS